MKFKKNWFFKVILFPFVVTRSILLFIGLVSQSFLPISSLQTEEVISKGWLFSSNRLIDIWSRWDSGWYLSIIQNGYSMGKDVYTHSNLAFFPVYPYLVKFLTSLVSVRSLNNETTILVGVILSNIMLLGSLVLLYKIALHIFNNETIAKNSIWYLLVFPSSFFLSSFYTESTFLFFSLFSYWAVTKRKWWLACTMASIATATRSIGLILVLPLLLEYFRSKGNNFKKIDFSILWFAIIPLGILLFFYYMWSLTGDFFAAVKVQDSWGRKIADPVSSLLFPSGFWIYLTPLDQIFAVGVLIVSWTMFKEKLKVLRSLGLYSILLIVPALFTGTLDSLTRYLVVIFPLFIYWAFLVSKSKKFDIATKIVFMSLQVIFFALFSQFYWVG